MRLAQVIWVCNGSCKNSLSPSCAKMNLWKLPFIVDKDFECRAWLCVFFFALLPTAFVIFRTWTIWNHYSPVVESSMSSSSEWGSLPEIKICDKQGKPVMSSCILYHFQQLDEPVVKNKKLVTECKSKRIVKGHVEEDEFAITHYNLPKGIYGHCLYLNMSSLQPTASLVESLLKRMPSQPSKVLLKFHVLGTSEDRVSVFAVDPDPTLPWSLLTTLNAGTSLVELDKREVGYVGFRGKNMSFWESLKSMWSPKLKGIYTTQLEAYNPDLDMEHLSENTTKRLDLLAKVQEIMIRAKNLSQGDENRKIKELREKIKKVQTYQNYALVMSIQTQHIPKDLEIGRAGQTLALLSKIGGWMSVIACLLGLCWVQKHPNDEVVKTYNTRTFIGSQDPSETQFTRSPKAGPEWAHWDVQWKQIALSSFLDLRKALTSVNHHPEEPSLQSLGLIRVSLEGCVGPASQLRLLSAVSPPL